MYRIQLIMCDAYLAGIYGRKFEEAHYYVHICESVDDAIRHAGRVKPHIILYDIHCTPDPRLIVQKFHSIPAYKNTKIFLLGHIAEWDHVQELKRISDGYLIFGQFVPREAVEKITHLLSL